MENVKLDVENRKLNGEPKIDLLIDLLTISEANATGEHWTKKHKRHKAQKLRVLIELMNHQVKVQLPCIIKLSRLSPRLLDTGDNLPMSLKYIRDSISEYIFPNKKAGRADDDPRIEWQYAQEKSKKKAVRIQIYF